MKFLVGVWFLLVETKAKNKEPLQALAYPSCLLKKDAEVTKSFLVVRTLICFQRASSLFPELSNNVEQTTTGGARCQNRTALLVPKTRVLPLHFILHINGAPCRNWTHFWCLQNNCSNHWANGAYKWHYRSPHACISFLSTLVPIQVGFVIPPNFYQAVDRLFSSFPFNISALTQQANCSAPIRFASGRGWTYDGSDPSFYNASSSGASFLQSEQVRLHIATLS